MSDEKQHVTPEGVELMLMKMLAERDKAIYRRMYTFHRENTETNKTILETVQRQGQTMISRLDTQDKVLANLQAGQHRITRALRSGYEVLVKVATVGGRVQKSFVQLGILALAGWNLALRGWPWLRSTLVALWHHLANHRDGR